MAIWNPHWHLSTAVSTVQAGASGVASGKSAKSFTITVNSPDHPISGSRSEWPHSCTGQAGPANAPAHWTDLFGSRKILRLSVPQPAKPNSVIHSELSDWTGNIDHYKVALKPGQNWGSAVALARCSAVRFGISAVLYGRRLSHHRGVAWEPRKYPSYDEGADCPRLRCGLELYTEKTSNGASKWTPWTPLTSTKMKPVQDLAWAPTGPAGRVPGGHC